MPIHQPPPFGGGIKNASFDEDYFDVIYMSQVLEHLTDPLVELRILNRLLKPDGLFVHQVALYETLGWNLRKEYVYYDVPRHVIHLTDKSLTPLMTMAGFKIRKKMHLPYSWGFFFSDFKRFCTTGSPADCNDSTILVPRWRHKMLGFISWLVHSSGNICVYAVKEQKDLKK